MYTKIEFYKFYALIITNSSIINKKAIHKFSFHKNNVNKRKIVINPRNKWSATAVRWPAYPEIFCLFLLLVWFSHFNLKYMSLGFLHEKFFLYFGQREERQLLYNFNYF